MRDPFHMRIDQMFGLPNKRWVGRFNSDSRKTVNRSKYKPHWIYVCYKKENNKSSHMTLFHYKTASYVKHNHTYISAHIVYMYANSKKVCLYTFQRSVWQWRIQTLSYTHMIHKSRYTQSSVSTCVDMFNVFSRDKRIYAIFDVVIARFVCSVMFFVVDYLLVEHSHCYSMDLDLLIFHGGIFSDSVCTLSPFNFFG